jgi:hypothetical protein
MSMLVIRTQVYENYGAHNWDGIGKCPQYWKAKGGSDYKILNVPMNVLWEEVVSMADIEQDNDYLRESIIDWSIEPDDYLSWFEKSQLEYDGKILYKEPTMMYNELTEERTMA